MMLRLVLVGIVAALGITLPSPTQCESWLGKAENWASSFLATHDRWRPSEFAPLSPQDVALAQECTQCRLAWLGAPRHELSGTGERGAEAAKIGTSAIAGVARTARRESLKPMPARPVGGLSIHFEAMEVFAPIAIDRRAANAIDGQAANSPLLIRNDDVADDQPNAPAPAASAATAAALVDGWVFMSPASGYGPELFEAVAYQLEEWGVDDAGPTHGRAPCLTGSLPAAPAPPSVLGLGTELNPQPESAASSIQEKTAAALPVAQTVIPMSETAALIPWPVFAPAPAPARAEAETQLVHETTVPWPVLAPARTEAETERVHETVVASPAFAPASVRAEAQAERVHETTVPWPVFAPAPARAESETQLVHETIVPWPVFAPTEPVDSGATLASTPAGRSPGERLPAVSSSRVPGERGNPPVEPGWGEAIRLTHQAVRAWADVLAGPARVEVTAR